MSTQHDVADDVEQTARSAASSNVVVTLSRFGMLARAVAYLLVAYLTVRAALGTTSRQVGGSGALHTVASQAGGGPILFTLAVGFAGFALFQLVDAAFHHGDEATAKRWGDRLLSLWGTLLYGVFCAQALSLALGSGGSGSGGSSSASSGSGGSSSHSGTTSLAARVLHDPAGRVVLAAVGIGICIGAGGLVRRALIANFLDRLERDRVPSRVWPVARVLGSIGCWARAAAYVLVGVFVVKAAIVVKAGQAEGLDVAVRTTARTAWGPYLLIAIAAGFVAYAGYLVVEAAYRRV